MSRFRRDQCERVYHPSYATAIRRDTSPLLFRYVLHHIAKEFEIYDDKEYASAARRIWKKFIRASALARARAKGTFLRYAFGPRLRYISNDSRIIST